MNWAECWWFSPFKNSPYVVLQTRTHTRMKVFVLTVRKRWFKPTVVIKPVHVSICQRFAKTFLWICFCFLKKELEVWCVYHQTDPTSSGRFHRRQEQRLKRRTLRLSTGVGVPLPRPSLGMVLVVCSCRIRCGVLLFFLFGRRGFDYCSINLPSVRKHKP